MRKIFIFLFFVVWLFGSSFHKVNLYKYCSIVSSFSNKNILIDSKVPADKISFFIPKRIEGFDYLSSLNSLLQDYNLTLLSKGSYYYVTYKRSVLKKLYFYKFKNIPFSNISFISSLFPTLKFHFFKVSNILFFKSSPSVSLSVFKVLKKIDNKLLSAKVSLSIYLINYKKFKNLGLDTKKLGFNFNNILQYANNTFSLTANNTLSFLSSINFLISKGVVKIVQQPVFLLTDNKKITFYSGLTIPFRSSVTTVKNNTVSTQNNISYKDIGLKINIVPRVFKKYIYLNFSLLSQNLLDNSLTPRTSKLEYSNSFKLLKHQSLLLSGLNVTSNYKDISKVPVLGYIPVLGNIFTHKNIKQTNNILTILITYLK